MTVTTWQRFGPALLVAGVLCLGTPAAADDRTPTLPEVLTLDEAAALLRIDPTSLATLAILNEVPARRIGAHWRFNREALLAWVNGDWTLIKTARPPDAAPLDAPTMSTVVGAGTRVAQSDGDEGVHRADGESSAANAADATDAATDTAPIGEAPAERTADEIFLRAQRVLLAPGEVTLDSGVFYASSDAQQLALVNGGVGLATIEQDVATVLLQARVGVLEETELFVSTTLRNEHTEAFFGSQRLSEDDRTEFGDVRIGIRRTLLREGPGYPDIIATLDARIPTGETSYAVGGGLALVKSVDPVVLFASANYRHTFSQDFADVTRLEAEDTIDVTLGYALALNDTLTISTAVSGLFTGETTFDNAILRPRDEFSLQFGLTSWLAEGLYIEPTVSIGLNGPGDSFAVGVTVPYTFTP